jgi:hypothetical protein
MSFKPDPIPDKAPVTADRQDSYVSPDWYRWLFKNVYGAIGSATQQVGTTLNLLAQHASISATALSLPVLQNGPYRVTSYMRVTAPDGAGSSFQLQIGWTESGVNLTSQGVAVTGDTTTTQQGLHFPIIVDQSTAITYQVTYSSTTPGKMNYRLSLMVESI